jgi:GNAT superfamily N-acetyltransferase
VSTGKEVVAGLGGGWIGGGNGGLQGELLPPRQAGSVFAQTTGREHCSTGLHSPTDVDVDVCLTSDLSVADWAELSQLNELVNGTRAQRQASPAGRLTWAGRDEMRWAVQARLDGGLLVSSLLVTTRRILVNGVNLAAGGISSVMTHPDYRRRGFARACMQRAARIIFEDEHVDLGLLLSSPMAVPLYASLGWERFAGPVWCEQPNAPRVDCQEAPGGPPMVLVPQGGPSSGTIDMCGLPW